MRGTPPSASQSRSAFLLPPRDVIVILLLPPLNRAIAPQQLMVCDGSGINILCIAATTEVHTTTQELDTPITYYHT
jgi:hypothetical protein